MGDEIYIEDEGLTVDPETIEASPRIGIDYAQDAIGTPVTLSPAVGPVMEVNGLGSVHGAYPVRTTQQPAEATQPNSLSPQGELEISSVGKMLQDMNGPSDVRAERLAQIKAAIDDGTYETSDKLQIALERLLDDIGYSDES